MTIKARLTIAVVALLVVATTILGWVTVSSTRSSLIGQIDDQLEASRVRPPSDPNRQRPLEPGIYRDTAELVYSTNGELLTETPAGFEDDPEPLPDLPRAGSEEFDELRDRITTVPATGGDFDYRVLTFLDRRNNLHVFATPLMRVDAAVSDLVRTFVFAGLAVLLIGGATSWFVIRRGMRPVDRMIGTASEIAGGDLSQRIDQRDGDRSELGRLAHALDDMLTQLEAAFTEREDSRRRLEQFVADASHELRTPVAAIRGYAELYRAGGIQPGEQLDRAMTRVEQESIRMGALVEDLLTLARLDEQQALERERVDLSVLALDAVNDLRAVEPSRPATIDADEPVFVRGDERRLRQVLANLLTNARVHTPAAAPVHVRVDVGGGLARLIVADEGPGIDDADRRRIFERFFRADKSRSRARGGAGLGLSIVAAVVAAHGGHVDVTSTDGRGATFTVVLPVDPEPDRGPHPARQVPG